MAKNSQKGKDAPGQLSRLIIIKRRLLPADSLVPYKLSSERQGLPWGQCKNDFLARIHLYFEARFELEGVYVELGGCCWRRGYYREPEAWIPVYTVQEKEASPMDHPQVCPGARDLWHSQQMLCASVTADTTGGSESLCSARVQGFGSL